MIAPGSSASNTAQLARTVTTADSATITDAAFDFEDAVDCSGWSSVLVLVRFVGGTNPTLTVQPLLRATETPDAGATSNWAAGITTSALAEGVGAVVEVGGRKTYLRAHAITGAPTSARILVCGWEPYRSGAPHRA